MGRGAVKLAPLRRRRRGERGAVKLAPLGPRSGRGGDYAEVGTSRRAVGYRLRPGTGGSGGLGANAGTVKDQIGTATGRCSPSRLGYELYLAAEPQWHAR